jgi:hypothetical protein
MKLLSGVVVLGVAATIAAAVSWGAIPDGDTIHGCFKNDTGALRVIDTGSGVSCNPKSETALDWAQTGTQGIQGSQGQQGPQGSTGPAGADGVSGYQVVAQTTTTYDQGGGIDGALDLVQCPDGTAVTGGGFDLPPSADVAVGSNSAFSTGWRVEVFGAAGVTFTAYAICVDEQALEGK